VRLPLVRGVIRRRLLVNYRVRPEVLRGILPAPFEPKTVDGWGMAGICLIRLDGLRPQVLPAGLGVSSENAAHRVAVEWTESGARQEGVFVRRRDTNAWWNVAAGGRLFPGVHHRADFDVDDSADGLRIALASHDADTRVTVSGRPALELPRTSVFRSLPEASRFFELGSRGYSPGRQGGRYEGLELRTHAWKVAAFDVHEVRSSFFESDTFDKGSAEFDCALLMRDVPHEWHALEPVCPT
jgi:hypothetical protein